MLLVTQISSQINSYLYKETQVGLGNKFCESINVRSVITTFYLQYNIACNEIFPVITKAIHETNPGNLKASRTRCGRGTLWWGANFPKSSTQQELRL